MTLFKVALFFDLETGFTQLADKDKSANDDDWNYDDCILKDVVSQSHSVEALSANSKT